MTFSLGKTTALYIGGYNFSGTRNAYDVEGGTEELDNTCFGSSFHRTSQPGLLTAKISAKGFYHYTLAPDNTGLENVLKAIVRVDTPFMACLPGAGTSPAAGDLADLFTVTSFTKKEAMQVDELAKLDLDMVSKDGYFPGVVMFAEAAFSGAPFNSTGYDYWGAPQAASKTFVTFLQVTAYTSGLAAVLVQTSTDNAAWTTRGTFPAITAIGGYALEITAVFDRYIRIRDTGVATIIGGVAVIG